MIEKSICYKKMTDLSKLLDSYPDAIAMVRGSELFSSINGVVRMYQIGEGVLVAAEVTGLPFSSEKCASKTYAMHIHEGESCTGNEEDPFADAKMHYNPNNCKHPQHAGDLMPLLGNRGYALSVFITHSFTVKEVVEKTVIIHSGVDDYTSQPSGNSGEKIACGKIKPCKLQ